MPIPDSGSSETLTPDRPHRSRLPAVLAIAAVAIAVTTCLGVTHAQDTPPTLRSELVTGESLPYLADYGDVRAFMNLPTVAPGLVPARVPGFPVRQHPVNTGLYQTAGCQQCHRLAGPIPQNAGAPPDIYDQLPPPDVQHPPPDRFTRLTTTPTRDEYPTWSPNGHHLLYETRDPNGHYNLTLINADGTHPRQITHHQAAGWATWHPDGSRIAYWASDTPQRGDIWIHDLASGTSERITDHDLTAWPQWNPDGTWLTYQAKDDQGWAIHLHNPTTNQHHTLTTNDTLPSRPLWNPDGTQILYQALHAGAFELTRLIFPTDTAGAPDYAATPRRVASPTPFAIDLGAATHRPTWNPDGDRIAYMSYELDVIPHTGLVYNYKSWTADPNGAYPVLLTPDGTLADRSPTWSPDGRWIAQWSWNPDYTAGIWLVDTDATRRIELTADLGGDALYPAWSPDGTRVAFASNRQGTFDIWIADVSDLIGAPTGDTAQ